MSAFFASLKSVKRENVFCAFLEGRKAQKTAAVFLSTCTDGRTRLVALGLAPRSLFNSLPKSDKTQTKKTKVLKSPSSSDSFLSDLGGAGCCIQ